MPPLRREGAKSAYVFVNERGQPFGRMGIGRMIERAGEAAELPFQIHVHKSRHGYAATATLPRPRQHVGATIEDATPTSRKDKPLFDIGEATERVAAAVAATRKLGFPFMLTARAEGFRRGNTDLDDAIKRLQAYEKAGADVLMAPGLPDLASVKAVCAAIAKPFNFMAGIPGKSFTVAGLEAAGVRRISLAGSLYRAAMGGLVAAACELKDKGTFGYVDTAALPSAELAGFMRE